MLYWHLYQIGQQREWPVKQLESARGLARASIVYHKTEGEYPKQLEDLVHKGTLTQNDFEGLLFQRAPGSPSEPWLYRPASSGTDFSIVSPRMVFPWSGHSGVWIAVRADGSGQLLAKAKSKWLPEWVMAPERRTNSKSP